MSFIGKCYYGDVKGRVVVRFTTKINASGLTSRILLRTDRQFNSSMPSFNVYIKNPAVNTEADLKVAEHSHGFGFIYEP